MIIQGVRNDKPVALPVDDNGRLLVSTNTISNQAVSIAETVTIKPVAVAAQNIAVTVGTPVVISGDGYSIPYPLTLRAKPGVGGTLLVEYRVDPTDDFTAWPSGTVSAATVMKLNGPVEALRFTAAVADGSARIAQ